jgi:hypothetical protein
MALGLLRGDRHYYHRSRPSAPLWAACVREMLRVRVTQSQIRRTRLDDGESLTPVQARGLKPCPRCFRDKES